MDQAGGQPVNWPKILFLVIGTLLAGIATIYLWYFLGVALVFFFAAWK